MFKKCQPRASRRALHPLPVHDTTTRWQVHRIKNRSVRNTRSREKMARVPIYQRRNSTGKERMRIRSQITIWNSKSMNIDNLELCVDILQSHQPDAYGLVSFISGICRSSFRARHNQQIDPRCRSRRYWMWIWRSTCCPCSKASQYFITRHVPSISYPYHFLTIWQVWRFDHKSQNTSKSASKPYE